MIMNGFKSTLNSTLHKIALTSSGHTAEEFAKLHLTTKSYKVFNKKFLPIHPNFRKIG